MPATKRTRATKIPQDARSRDEITRLSHDNVCQGDFSIMIDPDVVWLNEQPSGKERAQHIEMPRRTFDAFVLWYTTGKIPPGDKAWR